ncbi:hypothetical protein [Cohnella faecalis]|uniref:Uncharacterized protein n=1 Tax=Cohnella faecalis TaxID=2315694 RepID=A0A398CNI5_9BACL|nr:hypothetical protein [Cohnella faecalis]RIE04926.1 hypothetical protein D3H35_03475 [Cohnella faecalis]
MSRNKKVWIPAMIAAAIAALLVVYYYWTSAHGGERFARARWQGRDIVRRKMETNAMEAISRL